MHGRPRVVVRRVCVHTHAHAPTHAHEDAYTRKRMHTRTDAHALAHTHASTHARAHAHAHAHQVQEVVLRDGNGLTFGTKDGLISLLIG